MALNFVTLTLDIEDGQGNLPGRGCTAVFTPSAVLTDAGVVIVGQAPVTAVFTGITQPSVKLLATDSAGLQPSGWTWGVTFTGPGMPAPFAFFLPFASGASQVLSSLIPVQSGTSFQAYMPLPSGTPSAGQVPVATGTGEASAWGTAGSGSGTVTTVSVATANGFAGTVANPSATPSLTLETTVSGLLKGNGTAVSAAAAGTDYLAPSGSGAGLTGITAGQVGALPASDDLSAIAAANPTAGDVAMNGHKLTGVASGAVSSDGAAYGQTPAGGNTVTIGQGGTGQVTQQAAIDALTGAQSAGKVLRSDGTHATLSAIQAADVPVLNQSTTGTAGGLSSTLAIGSGGTGQVTAPAALAALGGAADSAVVHLAGTETITGAKTFSVPPNLATQSVPGTATLAAASAPVVLTDTTAGAFTLTLPAAPVAGEFFIIVDDTGQWNAHALTVARNGKSIDGAAADLTLVSQWGKAWLYYDGAAWWTLAAGASNETPLIDGAAAAGTRMSYSRADHVHPMPRLDQAGAPAASVSLNSQKITGLANGSAATDAAALGQVVASVAAADTSVTVGGTATAPTVATGTLDVIAADHPPAANWSNNGKKITSLANGTAASDAAAFGQLPSGSSPLGTGSGGTGRTTSPAAAQSFAPANPAPTSSTTEVMMGLGSTCSYTPASTGRVLVIVGLFATTATGLVSITAGGRFGTGTAPANGAAVTGTAFGPVADPAIRAPAIGQFGGMPFSAVLSLTAGTTYWFDLAVSTANASDAASVANVTVSIAELA